jgi:hypothetical protein
VNAQGRANPNHTLAKWARRVSSVSPRPRPVVESVVQASDDFDVSPASGAGAGLFNMCDTAVGPSPISPPQGVRIIR